MYSGETCIPGALHDDSSSLAGSVFPGSAHSSREAACHVGRHSDPPCGRLIGRPPGMELLEPRLEEAALLDRVDKAGRLEIQEPQRPGPLGKEQKPPGECR